jgi:hypothetical protein
MVRGGRGVTESWHSDGLNAKAKGNKGHFTQGNWTPKCGFGRKWPINDRLNIRKMAEKCKGGGLAPFFNPLRAGHFPNE